VSFFQWALRNGAQILFWSSLLVFAASFAGQYLLGLSPDGSLILSREPGHSPGRLWFFVTSFSAALSNSALIFAAACIVALLDRRFATPRSEDR
jgi:hypothetical protein